jgi:hypothetical protein
MVKFISQFKYFSKLNTEMDIYSIGKKLQKSDFRRLQREEIQRIYM